MGKRSKSRKTKTNRELANLRERRRMHLMNEGYNTLRRLLPDAEKRTKIDTLKAATEYINQLQNVLADSSAQIQQPPSENDGIKDEKKNEDTRNVFENTINWSNEWTATQNAVWTPPTH